jgi:hypothetical protein
MKDQFAIRFSESALRGYCHVKFKKLLGKKAIPSNHLPSIEELSSRPTSANLYFILLAVMGFTLGILLVDFFKSYLH